MKHILMILLAATISATSIHSPGANMTSYRETESKKEQQFVFRAEEEGIQTITYPDQFGNPVTVSVAYSPAESSGVKNAAVSTGTYTVSASTDLLSMSFKIFVINTEIISVYDAQFSTTLGTISNPVLSRLSLKAAKLTVTYSSGSSSWTKWLKCEINSSNELIITKNY